VTATDAEGLTGAPHVFTITVTPNPTGARPITGPPADVAPPAAPQAQFTLADRTLKLSRSGSVPVRIDCDQWAECVATVSLAAGKRKLGTARFTVAADTIGTATLKLSKANRKRLARKRKANVVLTVALAGQEPVSIARKLKTR
jgi:hypothetical protein